MNLLLPNVYNAILLNKVTKIILKKLSSFNGTVICDSNSSSIITSDLPFMMLVALTYLMPRLCSNTSNIIFSSL